MCCAILFINTRVTTSSNDGGKVRSHFPRLEYAFSTVTSQCGDASDASASVTCVARTLWETTRAQHTVSMVQASSALLINYLGTITGVTSLVAPTPGISWQPRPDVAMRVELLANCHRLVFSQSSASRRVFIIAYTDTSPAISVHT